MGGTPDNRTEGARLYNEPYGGNNKGEGKIVPLKMTARKMETEI